MSAYFFLADKMHVHLHRISDIETGTYGILLLNNAPLCLTLEDCWLDNQPYISCIPAGTYDCVRYKSSKFGRVWLVKNVPERTGILFHEGNYAGTKGERDGNTTGCILFGSTLLFDYEGRTVGVGRSLDAERLFNKQLLHYDAFTLVIHDVPFQTPLYTP